MVYKYFIGANLSDLKYLYKELCKKLHPDVQGGSHEKFTEMANEYNYINTYSYKIIFPINNENDIRNAKFWDQFNRNFGSEFYKKHYNANKEHNEYGEHKKTAQENFWSRHFDGFQAENTKSNRTKNQNTHRGFQDAEYLRVEHFFNQLRVNDGIYDVIDGIIKEQKKLGEDRVWCYFELCKLTDLQLNHFKYLRWKTNIGGNEWVIKAYNNYRAARMGWTI